MNVAGRDMTVDINLPGGYNIYNAAGVMTIATAARFSPESAVSALSDFECGFGRMEKFEMNGSDVQMILIKNPAGCNQVLNYLTQLREPFTFVACLNDRAQDGVDVSWIWDVDFELLSDLAGRIDKIIVSGDRAPDMAVRIKYAGIAPEHIEIERDYEKLVSALEKQSLPVFIMPTYTAMLELREVLIKHCGGADFWE